MADLCCNANTCMYNKDELCCKGDIMVGGKHACEKEETCCDSFAEKRSDSYSSAMDHPSQTISIDCEAAKCKYNTDYKCYADHVDIRGAGAAGSKETACGTFTAVLKGKNNSH